MNVTDVTLHYCSKCGGIISHVINDYQVTRTAEYDEDGVMSITEDTDEERIDTWCYEHTNIRTEWVHTTSDVFKLLYTRLVGQKDFNVIRCSAEVVGKNIDEASLLEMLLC